MKTPNSTKLFLIVATIAVLILFGFKNSTEKSEFLQVKKFEYKSVRFSSITEVEQKIVQLNQLGKEGWEFLRWDPFYQGNTYYGDYAILKREY